MKEVEKSKRLIFTDFDGIFSHDMQYFNDHSPSRAPYKSTKTMALGARDAISILKNAGYEINIISGDSTENGQLITRKYLGNIEYDHLIFTPTKNKLAEILKIADGREFIWIGDDLIDLQIADYASRYITTTCAPMICQNNSDYRIEQKYFWHDLMHNLMYNLNSIENEFFDDDECPSIKLALSMYLRPNDDVNSIILNKPIRVNSHVNNRFLSISSPDSLIDQLRKSDMDYHYFTFDPKFFELGGFDIVNEKLKTRIIYNS